MNVVAPWCLASGVLISFTANAGQDFIEGSTRAALPARIVSPPADLVPDTALLAGELNLFGSGRSLLHEARLSVGTPKELFPPLDEIAPKIAMKPNARKFPEVVRAHKTNPAVGLRPAFDSRLREPGGLEEYLAENLIFGRQDLASTFTPYDNEATGPDSVAHFEPWSEEDYPTTTAEAQDGGG